jgi:hypothetical protein
MTFICRPIDTYIPTILTLSTYTDVGSFTWEAPSYVTSVEYLIVGGGGGGGAAYDTGSAGGGGAGLVLTGTFNTTPGTTYSLTVGDGGNGGTGTKLSTPYETSGVDGSSSAFSSITALGGGGGSLSRVNSEFQGLGGSVASGLVAPTGGYGAGNQAGGDNGGGGGGNTTAGGSVDLTPQKSQIGGAGLASSISGTNVTYGTGGAGGLVYSSANGVDGPHNTGNGGSGATSVSADAKSGGKGGSGLIILKYYV